MWLLAGLLLPMVLAACGGSDDSSDGADSSSRGQDAAVRYAQCMRANGVPNFPDPDASGKFRGQGHEQQDDPTFQAAAEKCRTLAPGGEHENAGDPEFVDQMRAYSQCMRDNGVSDFPDPDANGQLRGQGHEQRNDPTFEAASEACQSELPGGGDH